MATIIKLTLVHWYTQRIVEEPIFVNTNQLVWMQREEVRPSLLRTDGTIRTTASPFMVTRLMLIGYTPNVKETPEEILELIASKQQEAS